MNGRRAKEIRRKWRADGRKGTARRYRRQATAKTSEPPSRRAFLVTRASFRRMGEKSPKTGRWL